MLSVETESRITRLLMKLAEGEKAIEIIRQVLCGKIDFDALAAFKILDRENKNYITETNVKHFLKHYKVNSSNAELKQFFLFYCKNQENKMSLLEFLNVVITDTEPSMKKVAESRAGNAYRQLQPLSQDHEYALAKLLEQEMILAKNIDVICKDISARSDCNFYDIYSNFDPHRLNYITHDEIESFIVRNGYYPSENDINAIFKRLDVDRDGKISFEEFKRVITYQNYSKISSLQDEELNPNLLSYHSKDIMRDNNVNSDGNYQLTSRDLELRQSQTSFKGREKVDYEVANREITMKPSKEKVYNETGRIKSDTITVDSGRLSVNSHERNRNPSQPTENEGYYKQSTLEREFNKASPKKTNQ